MVKYLLQLSKERMSARSTRTDLLFQPEDFVYLFTKGLHIQSQKCKHIREQQLGPFKVLCKVSINSYKLSSPKGCRLHPVFFVTCLFYASSTRSLRPHYAEIEGDHEEYAIDFISDVTIDNWPRRIDPYLYFLTRFVSFDIPKWMLLEQVDECV